MTHAHLLYENHYFNPPFMYIIDPGMATANEIAVLGTIGSFLTILHAHVNKKVNINEVRQAAAGFTHGAGGTRSHPGAGFTAYLRQRNSSAFL